MKQKSYVHIKISNVPQDLDLVGYLRKYSGDLLVENIRIDSGVNGQEEELNTILDTGTYYLWVYDYFNHWDYEDYDVQVDISPLETGSSDVVWEQEPNDTPEQANLIEYDDMMGGFFQTYQDYDVFKVDLPYDGDIVITIGNPDVSYLTPLALLVDENLNNMDVSFITPDMENNEKLVFEEFDGIKKGTYYIVLANGDDVSDTLHPYLFSISYLNAEVKTMSLNYTNEITFDIKLDEDIGIKSVDLLDGSQVLASTENIRGNKAILEYSGQLNKSSYQVRVWSVDGRYGTKDVEIKSSMEVIEIDAVRGLVRIRALMAGNLYKNDQLIKSMNKNDEYLFEDVKSGDTIKLVPFTGEIAPASRF